MPPSTASPMTITAAAAMTIQIHVAIPPPSPAVGTAGSEGLTARVAVRFRVSELGQKVAGFGLDAGDLLRRQLLPPPADRRVAEAIERAVRRRDIRAEELGEGLGGAGEVLVPELEEPVAGARRAN